MSKVNLYANLAPHFWKISHGNDCISETEAAAFEKRRVVVVHKDTAAKGKSKVSQSEDFMAAMKNGDFFYLCRGNSIRLLGRIDSDEIDENPAFSTKGKDKYKKADFLKDVYMTEAKYDRLASVLKKKRNIILQGAPGVGKTFAAKRLAYSIMGEADDDRIEFVQFHQNYSYEDFMMGYKPVNEGFEFKYGIFYRFCQKAANHPDKDYFFIIDEINRGNMSKIFGELLMLIEADYRDKKATLAYNGLSFSVPKRLHIIRKSPLPLHRYPGRSMMAFEQFFL